MVMTELIPLVIVFGQAGMMAKRNGLRLSKMLRFGTKPVLGGETPGRNLANRTRDPSSKSGCVNAISHRENEMRDRRLGTGHSSLLA
jgi:hypothetical protein